MQEEKTIPFAQAGTKTSYYDWTINWSDTYWLKIHIGEPNDQTFGPFTFTLACP